MITEAERIACKERLACATRIHEAAHEADCLCSVELTPDAGLVITTGTFAAITRLRALVPADLVRRSSVVKESIDGATVRWVL